mgnify:CR=1 FL=1
MKEKIQDVTAFVTEGCYNKATKRNMGDHFACVRGKTGEKPILAFCFVFNKASLSEQNAEEFRRNRCRGKPLETAGRKARGLTRDTPPCQPGRHGFRSSKCGKENENGKKQQGGYELCKGKTVHRF